MAEKEEPKDPEEDIKRKIPVIPLPPEYAEMYNRYYQRYGQHNLAIFGMMDELKGKKSPTANVDDIEVMRRLAERYDSGGEMKTLKALLDSETGAGLSMAQQEKLRQYIADKFGIQDDRGNSKKPLLTREDIESLKEIKKMKMLLKEMGDSDDDRKSPYNEAWLEDRREQRQHELRMAEERAEQRRMDNITMMVTLSGKKDEGMNPILMALLERDKEGAFRHFETLTSQVTDMSGRLDEEKEKARQQELFTMRESMNLQIESIKDLITTVATSNRENKGSISDQVTEALSKANELDRAILEYAKGKGLTEKEAKSAIEKEGLTWDTVVKDGLKTVDKLLNTYLEHRSNQPPKVQDNAGSQQQPQQQVNLDNLPPDEQQQFLDLMAKAQGTPNQTPATGTGDSSMGLPPVGSEPEPSIEVPPPEASDNFLKYRGWYFSTHPNSKQVDAVNAWHAHRKKK